MRIIKSIRNKKIYLFEIIVITISLFLSVEVFLLIKENMRLKSSLNLQSKRSNIEIIRVGEEMPYFHLESIAGEQWDMANHKGERLFLIFFSSHCGACELGATIWKKIFDERTKGEDIKIIGITKDEKEDIVNFASNKGLKFPILLDRDWNVFKSYRVQGIPMMIMASPGGKVGHVLLGIARKDLPILDEFFGVKIEDDFFKITK